MNKNQEVISLVDKVLLIYRKSAKIITLDDEFVFADTGVLVNKKEANNQIKFINDIIDLMSERNKFFIKCLLDGQNNIDWWKNYYSRATYYRVKESAYSELYKLLTLR